jgi:hypothetical protein
MTIILFLQQTLHQRKLGSKTQHSQMMNIPNKWKTYQGSLRNETGE